MSATARELNFGNALRKARQDAGYDLRRLSDVTRVQTRYIEALEEEDWGSVPKGVIGRGFVRLIAREIGADSEDLLERYRVSRGEDPLAHLVHYTNEEEEMDMEVGRPAPAFGRSFERGPLLIVIAAVVLMALIGAGLWLWGPWGGKGSVEKGVKAARVAEPVEPAAAPVKVILLEIAASRETAVTVEGEGLEAGKLDLKPGDVKKLEVSKKARLILADPTSVALVWNGVMLKLPDTPGVEAVILLPDDAEKFKP